MLGVRGSAYEFWGGTIQPTALYNSEATGPGTTLWGPLSGLDWQNKEMTSEKTFPDCGRQSSAFFLSTSVLFSPSLSRKLSVCFNYFPWQIIFWDCSLLPFVLNHFKSVSDTNLGVLPATHTYICRLELILVVTALIFLLFFLLLYLFLLMAWLLTIYLNGTMESYMTFSFPLFPMPRNQIWQHLPVHFSVAISSLISLASIFIWVLQ